MNTRAAIAEAQLANEIDNHKATERNRADWETRAAKAEASASVMARALSGAAKVFGYYAELHFAKRTPEGDEKALANLAEARKCEAALASFNPHSK